ncbi:hypothetical protein [Rhizobium sp. Root651]|uniref:hypothetical protein n=1 Tax=Rhizobium sp. Root651 TaxID=1736577 RepID=UPI0012E3AB7F|nr:hypothetical protein [Rhizobium sp. Root651]
MSKKTTLSDFRNLMEGVNRAIMAERGDGEAPNAEVLARMRVRHAKEMKELNSQLLDIALVKLNNEVNSRKGARALTQDGVDLFGTYHRIPKGISVGKGRKKDTAKVTFFEADHYLDARRKPKDDKNDDEFKRLVEDCRPFKQSDDDTLEICMKRKIDAERKGELRL